MNIIMTFLQPPGPLGIKLSHCSKVKCSASSRGKSSSLIFIIIMFLAWRHFHHYITTVVIFRTITYKSFPSKYVRSCSFFSRFCFKNFVNRCLSQTPRFLSGIWLKFWNLEALIWAESGVMRKICAHQLSCRTLLWTFHHIFATTKLWFGDASPRTSEH